MPKDFNDDDRVPKHPKTTDDYIKVQKWEEEFMDFLDPPVEGRLSDGALWGGSSLSQSSRRGASLHGQGHQEGGPTLQGEVGLGSKR